jgi:hypothetical protein
MFNSLLIDDDEWRREFCWKIFTLFFFGVSSLVHSPASFCIVFDMWMKARAQVNKCVNKIAAPKYIYIYYMHLTRVTTWNVDRWDDPNGTGGDDGGNVHSVRLIFLSQMWSLVLFKTLCKTSKIFVVICFVNKKFFQISLYLIKTNDL